MRQKVKDAIRNKVSVEALKRNSKKWTCEARDECLRAWDEELKPALIAKRQRDNTKQSQMVMSASESFCFDFDSEESKKISLIKLIQCISDDVTDWQKLNVFKKGLKAFQNRRLEDIRNLWTEVLDDDDSKIEQAKKFFQFGLDHLNLSPQLDADQDGPWMAQFFIAIYLLPTKDDIANDALNAWQLWVYGGDGEEPTIRPSIERILLQEWS